jgi:hypothetical protein
VHWINLRALEFCLMRAMERGAIIHIASISAQHGNPGQSAYGAFKGGVITLIQLKYPVPERPWLACCGRGLKA